MSQSMRHSSLPALEPWANIALIPFGVVVIITMIPVLIAMLPVFGLFWIGAKR
ncbi:hypothetical protein [Paraburkholderia fungorum]|uniref:hypothetical protein n=1 Tax=Paraburkholderia fungorum TaxID=134537 RepID=UPI003D6AE8B9